MANDDAQRWDEHYRSGVAPLAELPERFMPFVANAANEAEHLTAIDVACGRGSASVWLASRGYQVRGYDISSEAINQAKALAVAHDVNGKCDFFVHDFDDALPEGPGVDVVLCNMFRDPQLYRPMSERLVSGGLLLIAVLSEVGAKPGRFRARPGELVAAFDQLRILGQDESDGVAWLAAQKNL